MNRGPRSPSSESRRKGLPRSSPTTRAVSQPSRLPACQDIGLATALKDPAADGSCGVALIPDVQSAWNQGDGAPMPGEQPHRLARATMA